MTFANLIYQYKILINWSARWPTLGGKFYYHSYFYPIPRAHINDMILSDAIQSEINKWGFADQGFNYYVVAILGCQSSGKSKYLQLNYYTYNTYNYWHFIALVTKSP